MLIKTEGSTSRKRYTWGILHLDHEEKNVIHRPDDTKVKYPHSDPLLITAIICSWDTNWVYIDTGTNKNMIFKELMDELKDLLSQVKHSSGFTFGVGRDSIPTLGVVTLSILLTGMTATRL